MACWPANSVGAFFLALLMYDLIRGDYAGLPYHAVVGIFLTLVFWGICALLGEAISGAILLVPATFLLVFLFSMWLAGRAFEKRDPPCPQANSCTPQCWYIKPNTKAKDSVSEVSPGLSPSPPLTPILTSSTNSCVNSSLKATPLQ